MQRVLGRECVWEGDGRTAYATGIATASSGADCNPPVRHCQLIPPCHPNGMDPTPHPIRPRPSEKNNDPPHQNTHTHIMSATSTSGRQAARWAALMWRCSRGAWRALGATPPTRTPQAAARCCCRCGQGAWQTPRGSPGTGGKGDFWLVMHSPCQCASLQTMEGYASPHSTPCTMGSSSSSSRAPNTAAADRCVCAALLCGYDHAVCAAAVWCRVHAAGRGRRRPCPSSSMHSRRRMAPLPPQPRGHSHLQPPTTSLSWSSGEGRTLTWHRLLATSQRQVACTAALPCLACPTRPPAGLLGRAGRTASRLACVPACLATRLPAWQPEQG